MGIDRIGALNHSKKINSLHSKKIKIFFISRRPNLRRKEKLNRRKKIQVIQVIQTFCEKENTRHDRLNELIRTSISLN